MSQHKIDLELENSRKALEAITLLWETNREIIIPLIEELEALDVDCSLSSELDLRFSGNKTKLAAVLRCVYKRGWRFEGDPRPKEGETSWHGRLHNSDILLPIWLSFTSSVCRRVPVGTQTVEQTIYKVICDE